MSTGTIWIVIAAVAAVLLIAALTIVGRRARSRRRQRQAEEIREQARLETAKLERREALAEETAAKARAAQAEAEVKAAEAASLQEPPNIRAKWRPRASNSRSSGTTLTASTPRPGIKRARLRSPYEVAAKRGIGIARCIQHLQQGKLIQGHRAHPHDGHAAGSSVITGTTQVHGAHLWRGPVTAQGDITDALLIITIIFN
ncbi:MAG TPA: hypothetical protein VNY55_18075 [Mycobacterium sp.]|nr:hypothetical protein [Mycobacterium sp.]